MRYALLAACMAHVEGYYSTESLAFRNKNPGNIKDSETGQFQVYHTPLDGFACLVDDIEANAGRTLAAFLIKYAPPSENDSSMYIGVVSQLSGIAPNEVL